MKFFALFIYRPVATILISLAITLCGILGFRLLPVAPLPQVDFPVIMVSASLPGASPTSAMRIPGPPSAKTTCWRLLAIEQQVHATAPVSFCYRQGLDQTNGIDG